MWIQNHTQSEPKNYIETTHEESWYPCNQCDYKTTHNAKLKNHLETTKEESWYPCNQCEYKTTHRANLKNHVETTPEESWYPCNQCEYKTTHKAKLKNHVEKLTKNHDTPVTNVNRKPHTTWWPYIIFLPISSISTINV